MRRIRVGRVEVSCFFLFLCACMLYRDRSGMAGEGFLACILHEMGHCAALLLIGNSVKQINITAFGAKILPNGSLSYGKELLVAAAGPGVNILLAYLCTRVSDGTAFAGVNLALAVFNLLPIGDLDGARILRCAMALIAPDEFTSCMMQCLGYCFTAVFSIFGVVMAAQYQNITLLLMSLWLLWRLVQEK